jgi:hypothetical protein
MLSIVCCPSFISPIVMAWKERKQRAAKGKEMLRKRRIRWVRASRAWSARVERGTLVGEGSGVVRKACRRRIGT